MLGADHDLPFAARRTHHAAVEPMREMPPFLVNQAPDHPRSTRLTHRVLRTGDIDIDTQITVVPPRRPTAGIMKETR